MKKRISVTAILIVFLLQTIFQFSFSEKTFAQTQTQDKTFLFEQIKKENSYESFLNKYSKTAQPKKEYIINGANYLNFEGEGFKKLENFEGTNEPVILTGDSGFIEWEVNIEEEGLYNISIKYFPIEGKSSSIEREILIDGERQFNEARNIKFERVWRNAGEVRKDNRGNEIRPIQEESPMWIEKAVRDSEGLYPEPFKFYFTKGKHTIRLISVREPMVIQYIKIHNLEPLKSYNEIEKEYKQRGYKEVKNVSIKVQGESAYIKSEPTLYPISDRTNPLNEPYDVSEIRLNIIGGYNWRKPEQWIEWKINAPQDGLYKIGLKFRQNTVMGLPTLRSLYIDGQIPFKEAGNIKFPYDTNWQYKVIGQSDDKPYLFYLTAGEHTLRLETCYNDFAYIIRNVQQSAIDLSQLYTKIVMITGTNPDYYRDYQLDIRIPELIPTLKENAKILRQQVNEIVKVGGKKVNEASQIETIAIQLESLAEKPETIHQRLSKFRDNLSSLATWTLTIKEQPLDIDYFIISSKDAKNPIVRPNILIKTTDFFKKFFLSFIKNYNMIGNVYDKEKAVSVWVLLGRDQAETLKALIDSDFTPKTGIPVNLNIITNESVLLFAVSGQQDPPDVAINVSRGLPVDYGIRGALVDLSKLPGYKDVEKNFMQTAVVPYSYAGKVYGLPMTQDFPMMFYRKDILSKLKIDIPQTWEELYNAIAMLQQNNLQFGPGYGTSFDLFNMLLLQNGGKYYSDDAKKCLLDTPIGIKIFTQWTNLYTQYGVTRWYDFYSRFRTGELPLGIVNYTMYNQLSVAAPEISGLWGIAPVPGVKQPDGTIKRTVSGNGTAVVIFNQTKKLNSAWEFTKWWLSADTQARYGRELEALLGPAARYNTANYVAASYLPWPSSDYKVLKEQWKNVNEIPNIPGSYYTGRHLDNAFREVLDNNELPREAITKYVKEINKEIKKKREEFGFPVD
ncbi:extracellular solute-binding protein [Caldicellulosiruptoraceae bacterium PP1]